MDTIAPAEAGLLAAVTPVLIHNEDERLHVYEDIFGVPTIGVGFNLTRSDAQALCERCGANYQSLIGGLDDLTPAQSRFLLQQCIIQVVEWMVVIFPTFWAFTRPRQVALVDLGFNLGETKFKEFKQMIGHILVYDWYMAAADALHSIWASQVGQRAIDDANRLRTG